MESPSAIRHPPSAISHQPFEPLGVTMPNTIRIRPDVVYRDIDGAVVALSLTSGEYVGFDAVGSRIWHLIEQRGALRLVRSDLMAEYDLDEATCRAELDAFVETLTQKGLITVEANG